MIDFLAPPRAGLFFAFSTSKKLPQNVMANLVFIANFADVRLRLLIFSNLFRLNYILKIHQNELLLCVNNHTNAVPRVSLF